MSIFSREKIGTKGPRLYLNYILSLPLFCSSAVKEHVFRDLFPNTSIERGITDGFLIGYFKRFCWFYIGTGFVNIFTLILNICWKPAESYLGQMTIERLYDFGRSLFHRKFSLIHNISRFLSAVYFCHFPLVEVLLSSVVQYSPIMPNA